MNRIPRIPIEWIDRYLAGSCSEGECAQVEQWLANPEHRIVFESLRRELHDADPLPGMRGETAIWDAIRRRTAVDDVGDNQPIGTAKARERNRSVTPQWWMAATGAGLAIAGVLAGWHLETRQHALHGSVPAARYSTNNGERANITLPDGNMVVLDVASHIDVPADYLSGNHTLRLAGEALFIVQHRSGAPLTVIAGQTNARVLGTSFLMRHYATDSVTLVAVREGKVAVGQEVVTADRLVTISEHGSAIMSEAASALFTFAAGTLTLGDVSLPEAIPDLNRWYDADIRLGDASLATRGIGGKFAAGSLGELATILEMTLDVRVVRNGRVLTLFPRR